MVTAKHPSVPFEARVAGRRVFIVDTSQGPSQPQLRTALAGHSGTVWSIAYSPDGTTIATGSGDNTVRLWDAATGQPHGAPLTGHTSYVGSVAYTPDGTTGATGS